VYHGLPETLYQLEERPGEYLAFLGRISPEKGLEQAIAIAQTKRMKLKIAAKIDVADRLYYEEKIRPLISGEPLVEYIGEIGDHEKQEFLGNAYALLFPIDWPEPFGLVMIESMACGTPVVCFSRGSVPELVEDGISGFLVENAEEAVRALDRVAGLDRTKCRKAFESRFTAGRMAKDYVSIYRRILSERGTRPSLYLDGLPSQAI
jgi:glycosyltransferase involved in cell wall biosynthesis